MLGGALRLCPLQAAATRPRCGVPRPLGASCAPGAPREHVYHGFQLRGWQLAPSHALLGSLAPCLAPWLPGSLAAEPNDGAPPGIGRWRDVPPDGGRAGHMFTRSYRRHMLPIHFFPRVRPQHSCRKPTSAAAWHRGPVSSGARTNRVGVGSTTPCRRSHCPPSAGTRAPQLTAPCLRPRVPAACDGAQRRDTPLVIIPRARLCRRARSRQRHAPGRH